MARSPQPLSRILAADPTIAGWDARRRREDVLVHLVRRELPRLLADRVRVADTVDRQLTLAVDAGAIAAIVRQRTPELIAALQREGYEFTVIRVRVQVRPESEPRPKGKVNQPEMDSLRPLAAFEQSLAAGSLKSALARFLRRMR